MDSTVDRRKLIIAGAAVVGICAALFWTRRSYEAKIPKPPSRPQKNGLKIIVVGAGIAGLTTAVALRQAGHEVEVYERSAFATEVGAALIISPNGARVLSRLGFSFSNAKAVKMEFWDVLNGVNLQKLNSVDMRSAEAKFGFSPYAIHRVDLHSELLRLATSASLPGTPVKLHLSSEVVSATPDGSITLKDGTTRKAQLVVGADGIRSVLRGVVTTSAHPPKPTGLSAFRFLIDTDLLRRSKTSTHLLAKLGKGANLLADLKETVSERHMMWYACREGEVQNVVGIHPSRDMAQDDPQTAKVVMLEEFSHFDPEILAVIKKSSAIKCWPLFSHEPLEQWHNDRILVIGDAAHPMLPFGGQGANSAIEDAGTLGYVFEDVNDAELIPEKLAWFHRARHSRAAGVQILSSVRAGREPEVKDRLSKFDDPSIPRLPSNMMERTMHDFGFDVYKRCDAVAKS